MSCLPYCKGSKTYFINLLFPVIRRTPLCLGALPLLYPAAPPSVFAYFIGKYTALAVALGREYPVGFLGL